MKLHLATLLAAAALASGVAAPAFAESPDSRLQKLGDEFLDGWFTRRPHLATGFGLHGWDGRLVPTTAASVASDLAWLDGVQARLGQIPRAALSAGRAQEHDLLASRIERERIELDQVRAWKRDPGVYVEPVAGSVLAVLERDFASPCERVVLATRRLRLVPEVLRAARVNLEDPPRVHTEAAIAQLEGVLDFYRSGLPALTRECREPQLQADLAEADSQAVRAVEQFLEMLRVDVLPRSGGSFALGRDLLQRRLAAGEREEAPVESLLAAGWAALDEVRGRMTAVAERVAPGLGIAAALEALRRDAPGEGGLVPFVEAQLDSVLEFARQRAPLTPPDAQDLAVRETPSFRRPLSLASLDAPGVWERRATRAWLDVTPPPPGVSEPERREHLERFHRAAVRLVAVREALPGRYGQSLASRHAPSRLRQALVCDTALEGWAHYCEQLMVEEGLGSGDPRIELAWHERSLAGAGRLIAAISLHTGAMSLEDAARMFEERCFLPPADAVREARRAARDPDCMAEALGKWRILALRGEAGRMLGPAFRAREFHDLLLRQGAIPLPLAREGVLGELARRHRAAVGQER
jgi:uncharacterized protein (DUF885 family)